jgi:hypothetical protein
LGVFFAKPCQLEAGRGPTGKKVVFSTDIAGKLVFCQADKARSLAKSNYPSMLLGGSRRRQEAGVLIGFLSLVNHSCSFSDSNCTALSPQARTNIRTQSSVKVQVVRIGAVREHVEEGQQFLIFYGKSAFFETTGCRCEACVLPEAQGSRQKTASQVPCEDGTSIETQPKKRARRCDQ